MVENYHDIQTLHTVSLRLDNSSSDDKPEDSEVAISLLLGFIFFCTGLSLLFVCFDTDFCFRVGFAGRKSTASVSAAIDSETAEGMRFLYDLFFGGVSSAFRFAFVVLAAFPFPLGITAETEKVCYPDNG
jgi:hypothetical protein